MAIWVSKEPYQSDELIYGVENPQNRKKLSKKCKKLKCQFFLCIFGQIPLQTKSAFLPTKEAFLEFFQENKSCLELNSTQKK